MSNDNILRCTYCGKLTSKIETESRLVYEGKCGHCKGGILEPEAARYERTKALLQDRMAKQRELTDNLVKLAAELEIEQPEWVGPAASDLKTDGSLRNPVPPSRWPYGPPGAHEKTCLLYQMYDKLRSEGVYCDCKASEADDTEYGVTP